MVNMVNSLKSNYKLEGNKVEPFSFVFHKLN